MCSYVVCRYVSLPVAGGAVHGDQGGEDTHQEQDQHHVLRKPAAIVLSCIALYWRHCIVLLGPQC